MSGFRYYPERAVREKPKVYFTAHPDDYDQTLETIRREILDRQKGCAVFWLDGDVMPQDVEDYELTVGSYSLTDPFKVLKQYEKNLGGEVEVLTTDGRKLHGTLTAVDTEQFTITIPTKVKVEGKKRPEVQDVEHTFKYDEIKYTKNIIQF